MARAALRNRVPEAEFRAAQSHSLLDLVNIRFNFLSATAAYRILSLQRIAIVILMMTMGVALHGIISAGQSFSIGKTGQFGWVLSAMSETLILALVGVVIAVLVYAASAVFEVALERRRAKWQYFYDSNRLIGNSN